jgi:hypothetical protein
MALSRRHLRVGVVAADGVQDGHAVRDELLAGLRAVLTSAAEIPEL